MSKRPTFAHRYSLCITHAFFNGGAKTPIRIRPTPETSRALAFAGAIFRGDTGAITLLGQTALSDPLTFDLLAESPDLLSVTAQDAKPIPVDTILSITVDSADPVIETVACPNPRTFGTLKWTPEQVHTADVVLASFAVQRQFTILTMLKDLDLTHTWISGPDHKTAVPLAKRERISAAGRDAFALTPSGTWCLRFQPPASDQLVLHYQDNKGRPQAIPLPYPNINTLRQSDGAPLAEAMIYL